MRIANRYLVVPGKSTSRVQYRWDFPFVVDSVKVFEPRGWSSVNDTFVPSTVSPLTSLISSLMVAGFAFQSIDIAPKFCCPAGNYKTL